MKNSFKNVIENIKEQDLDCSKIKSYIKRIRKYVQEELKGDSEEITSQDCYEYYLENYSKEIGKKNNIPVQVLFSGTSLYDAFKELIQYSKSNQKEFEKLFNAAKKEFEKDPKKTLYNSLNPDEQKKSAIKMILKKNPNLKIKQLAQEAQKNKNEIGAELKTMLIKSIQDNVEFLDEMGFMDEYIKESNKVLEELNLNELKFERRNPRTDERYFDGKVAKYDENGKMIIEDENGKKIKDEKLYVEYFENIGLIDNFDTEELERLSIDDLLLMDTFWKSKYLQERIELSKANNVIKFLDIENLIYNGTDADIDEYDDESITLASKRDLALTYLCRTPEESTGSINSNRYYKFLKKSGMERKKTLTEEVEEEKKEVLELTGKACDIAFQECIIIGKLRNNNGKSMNIKDWGIVALEDENKENSVDTEFPSEEVGIAIESQNFRGHLVMSLPKSFIIQYFEDENVKLPRFKNEDKIDHEYSKIMSMIYIPINEYFKSRVSMEYDKNPANKLVANLAGKKAKQVGPEF